MKVIHVPFCFRPDPIGGTEVYVEALAREQQRRGLEVVLAAPAQRNSTYTDQGLSVRRFAVSDGRDIDGLYGDGDGVASHEFARVLDQERPNVVHLHSFTRAVSARLAETVKQQGVRLVFTYHTPTVSCQRGTLLRWGRTVCDGKLEVRRCAACTLHAHGTPRRSATLLGALPTAVGRLVGTIGPAGGIWTALRMTSLVDRQHSAFRSFVNNADRIVVLCQWTRDILLRNGVAPEKVVLSRHGLRAPSAPMHVEARLSGGPLRIAFLGRLHPTKGLDILLHAVTSSPAIPLQLDVFGVSESGADTTYVRSLKALAAEDPRVSLRDPVSSDQVISLLRSYDVLAVPSRWLETGPMVVLEAFAAGVPVVGSNLGGIRELVEDGVNGLLVEPDSVQSMRAALFELALQPDLLVRLRKGIRAPRRMDAVADDMQAIYCELLGLS